MRTLALAAVLATATATAAPAISLNIDLGAELGNGPFGFLNVNGEKDEKGGVADIKIGGELPKFFDPHKPGLEHKPILCLLKKCNHDDDKTPGYTPGHKPHTDMAPVPVPAALPLLIAGLGALGLVARRRG